MSSETPEGKNIDQFEHLFGPPPLLAGEDEERYLRLRAAIVRDLKPDDVLDWINAYDHINKLWEEQRYRRASVALINGALLKAVEFYLEDICEAPFHEEHALNFFSADPKEKKEVIADLAKHGITTAVLQAKAAQIEREGLQLFDRNGGGAGKRSPPAAQGKRTFSPAPERRPGRHRQVVGMERIDGKRKTDCSQPRQCEEEHRPQNGGRTLKVQPQRAPARLVGAAAAGSGDFGQGRRHRARPGRQRRQRGAVGVSCGICRGAP